MANLSEQSLVVLKTMKTVWLQLILLSAWVFAGYAYVTFQKAMSKKGLQLCQQLKLLNISVFSQNLYGIKFWESADSSDLLLW